MAFRLIPREEKFYADFIALADQLVIGAKLLEQLLASEPPDSRRRVVQRSGPRRPCGACSDRKAS